MPLRPQEVSSRNNPRLKNLQRYRKRRYRNQSGQTIIDGYPEIALAVSAGVRIKQLWMCRELWGSATSIGNFHAESELVDHAGKNGAQIYETNAHNFRACSYREGPDGLLAVVEQPGRLLSELHLPKNPLVLLAERIEKPGNLGAMLRTAEATGADAVIAVDPITDWGNPNLIRASKSTVFLVPVASATREETQNWLVENHIRVLAATPQAEKLHYHSDCTGAVAIAVGAEKPGLSAQFLADNPEHVRIDMRGAVNSLNVSTAAAVMLYESLRQRKIHPK